MLQLAKNSNVYEGIIGVKKRISLERIDAELFGEIPVPKTPITQYDDCVYFINEKDESFGGSNSDAIKICNFVETKEYNKYPILVHSENELLDGWHRLYAATLRGEKEVDVIYPTKRTKLLSHLLKNSGFYSDLDNIVEENCEKFECLD